MKLCQIDRHGNCPRIVAAAQLEAFNVTGVKSADMNGLFILSMEEGVRSKQKRILTPNLHQICEYSGMAALRVCCIRRRLATHSE